MQDRIGQLKKKLSEAAIDATFLVKPHNVFYFVNYASVCSGIVAFPESDPVFCTLWLDAPEAATVCTMPHVSSYVFPKDRLMARMIQLAKKHATRFERIGVEKDALVLRDYELLSDTFPNAEFVHIGPIVDYLRAFKTPAEIEKIQKAASMADAAMAAAISAVKPGVTEIEIAAEAEYVMRKLGSERPAFGTFVASGERTLLAHPHASHKRVEAGDPIVIDLGATWQGYSSDLCRTTFAGEPTREQRDYLKVILEAQRAAASVLRDGAVAGDVFERAYEIFKAHKMGNLLPDDIGYGVGLRQSEFYPIIERNSITVLAENMVVALMQTSAYLRRVGGLRVEDTFQITAVGCKRLTRHIQPTFD